MSNSSVTVGQCTASSLAEQELSRLNERFRRPVRMAHGYGFDPAFGQSLADMLRIEVPAAPEGFRAFWEDSFARNAGGGSLNCEVHRDDFWSRGDYETRVVFYNSWGDFRIGAWLLKPKKDPVTRGVVIGHGYGGRASPEGFIPIKGAALIFPCIRGFNLSRSAHVPDNPALHVILGIESRDSYVIRGCVADIWNAATVLETLVPETSGRLIYSGCSFGGGLGALAIPWDNRFRCAFLEVPTFGNHPVRLKSPCVGSGDAVSRLASRMPALLGTLPWYDAATALRYARQPVLVAAAAFDPAVPPPGQVTVFNALSENARETGLSHAFFPLTAGHFEYPEAAREHSDKENCVRNFVDRFC